MDSVDGRAEISVCNSELSESMGRASGHSGRVWLCLLIDKLDWFKLERAETHEGPSLTRAAMNSTVD